LGLYRKKTTPLPLKEKDIIDNYYIYIYSKHFSTNYGFGEFPHTFGETFIPSFGSVVSVLDAELPKIFQSHGHEDIFGALVIWGFPKS
jgi:hypothetical protein